MAFEIEKGVPISGIMRPNGYSIGSKYPFREMEVGHSFFVPHEDDPKRTSVRIGVASIYFTKQKGQDGKKFTVRKVDGGARCWRIA